MIKKGRAGGKNRVKLSVFLSLCACVILLSMVSIRDNHDAFHSEIEWEDYLRNVHMPPPQDTVKIFPTSSQCIGCHGSDPQMHAMVDEQGNDVNIHDDWSTSMMANSAKDPFWIAKVSHEVLANPAHKLALETKCTSCHAPQGHFTALLRGHEYYTMEQLASDTTGLDGVSCGACHLKAEENLENLFSGAANYDTTGVMFGTYMSPFAQPMINFVGFEPIFSEHINSSGICASCHTLFTNSVDLDGEFTGETFAEQATYHEWINSDFDDEGATPRSCQSCHMPRLEDDIVISANYLFLDARTPYALHDIIGSNIPMIKLIKENKEELGIEAADEHFDETISKTLVMLQENSLDLELDFVETLEDSIHFELLLTNKAGHKFPSGYPSRRLYIEFVVETEEGDTLFRSGMIDSEYRLKHHNNPYEPHYDVISQENQVQIYEYVVTNVEEEVTIILEQAYEGIKDNRLPPKGFTSQHAVYDTTQILGNALEDANFNYQNNEEGSGTDQLQYIVALKGYNGLVNVSAKVYYQALPPRWLDPMFAVQSAEINSFKSMYSAADMSPTLVAQDSLVDLYVESLSAEDVEENHISVFPNPSQNGQFYIQSTEVIHAIKIYDELGVIVKTFKGNISEFNLIDQKGVFFLEVVTIYHSKVMKIIVGIE